MNNFRKIVSNLYRNSELGYYILRPFYKIYIFGLKIVPDKVIIKRSFKKHMGYALKLDNPQTLNEKINWLKLYDRTALQTIVADKYKVRAYIEDKIGKQYLIPLIYHTKKADDLRPEKLPDSNFIIKTNHDSSDGLIVRDKSQIDWAAARKNFKRRLKENHYFNTMEWQYKNIEPRIVVEELLTYEDGSVPNDYKLHCFNGKLAFVHIDIDRYGDRKRNLYDANWNFLECMWQYENGKKERKPDLFEKMKSLAETIAKDFAYYARVDFYLVKGYIYFGEITFHHHSGFQKFNSHEWDYKFGQLLKLDKDNE